MRSMAFRSRYSTGEKQFFQRRPFRRDIGHRAVLFDLSADGVFVVILVTLQDVGGWH